MKGAHYWILYSWWGRCSNDAFIHNIWLCYSGGKRRFSLTSHSLPPPHNHKEEQMKSPLNIFVVLKTQKKKSLFNVQQRVGARGPFVSQVSVTLTADWYLSVSWVCVYVVCGYRRSTRWSSTQALEGIRTTWTGWSCWRRRSATTRMKPTRLRRRWRDSSTSCERSRPKRTTRIRR